MSDHDHTHAAPPTVPDDDELCVRTFGLGPRLAVAVHGITANGMAWPAVARNLPRQWRLVAPDLRGRGESNALPGPYGLARHAADICAIVETRGGGAVLIGHSMGAWVSLLAAAARPELFDRLILLDGGLPMPPAPADLPIDQVLRATIGPALDRLRQTYPTEQAYLDFFHAHPALAASWNDDIAAYARADITGEPGQLRSSVVEAAVQQDGRDVLDMGDEFAKAWDELSVPTLVICAPNGMLGRRPGLLPDQVVADAMARRPDFAVETLPEANHYTLVLDERFAATIARRIDDPSTWPQSS